jgi:hypothetical protein
MSQFPVDLPPTMLRTTLYTNKLIGNINVVGNITSNLIFAENIYGNLTSNNWYPGNVTDLNVDGNVTAGYFIGNGALLSGIAAGTLPSTANIDIVGNVSAPGNVSVAGQVNVLGNVMAPNFIGNIRGNIVGATILTNSIAANSILLYANLAVLQHVGVQGNVFAEYFVGNLVGMYANVDEVVAISGNVGNTKFAGGNVSVSGQINTLGNMVAPFFIGNGALLSGITTSALPSIANIDIIGNVSAPGNVDVSGQVNVTGNVVASFFVGNGSRVTALSPAAISAGTANVNLRGNVNGNTVVADESIYTFGELRAGNVLSTEYVRAVSGVVEATNYIYCRGNIFGEYFFSNGSYLADNSGNLTLTGGNLVMSGQINAVGNVVAPFFVGNGSRLTGLTASGVQNVDIRGNVIGRYANVGQVITSNLTVTSDKIAIGNAAGILDQGNLSIAIGSNAGYNLQGINSIAIGADAGSNDQSLNSIAIGTGAGRSSQGVTSIAVGPGAGSLSQGSGSTAIGSDAGQGAQGNFSVAVGYNAAQQSQGTQAVAIGLNAGTNTQGEYAVAIGSGAGQTVQGTRSVAVGYQSGGAGNNSVSIGSASSTADSNAIVLNATGSSLNSSGDSTLTIAPIRGSATASTTMLTYNTATKEVTYNTSGDVVANIIAAQGNVGNTRFLGGNVAVSGQVNVLGNVVAPFFVGNGSQLTGVTSTATSVINGNSNVIVVNNGNISMAVAGVANAFSLSGNGLMIRGNIFNSDGQLYNVPASYVRYVRTTTQSMTATVSNVILTTAETTFGSDITANTTTGVFTLAAGKTYRLRGSPGYIASGTATNFSYRWFNVTTAAFIGSSGQTESPSNVNNSAVLAGTAEATITPGVTTQVVLQMTGGVAFTLGVAIVGTTQGSLYPWAEIEVVGGQAPLTGVSQISGNIGGVFFENGNVFNYAGLLYNIPASYARYVRTATQSITASVTANVVLTSVETSFGTDIIGNTTTGIFTLAPGKTYRLRGYPGFWEPTTTAGFLACRWFNITTATNIGSSSQMESTNNNYIGAGFGGTAEAVITPSVTTQVVFQARSEQNGTVGKGQVPIVQAATFAWVDIEVIAGQAPISSTSTSNIDIRGNIIGPYANVANIIAVQGNVGNTQFLGGNVAVSGQINTLGNVVAPFFIGNGSQLTGVNVAGTVAGNLTMIANTYVFSQPTTFFWNAPVFGPPNVTGNNFLTATVVGTSGSYSVGPGPFYGWEFTSGLSGAYSTLNWTTGFDFRRDFRIDATIYISELGPFADDGMFFYVGGANVGPNMMVPANVTNGALSVSYDTSPVANATIRSNGALLNTTISKITKETWLGTVITCETLGGRRFLSLYTGSGGVLETSADVTSWTPRGNILTVGGWSGSVGQQAAYMNSIRLSYL